MKEEDDIKFSEIMVGIAESKGISLGTMALKLMFESLKPYALEDIFKASIIVMRTYKYSNMPSIAYFIEAIEGNPDDKAEIQKSIVMEAYNRYQPNHKFDDPITQGVINKIGWGKIGQVNKKDVPFLFNDFVAMYKSYKKVKSGCLLNAPPEIKNLVCNIVKEIE